MEEVNQKMNKNKSVLADTLLDFLISISGKWTWQNVLFIERLGIYYFHKYKTSQFFFSSSVFFYY